LPLATSLARRRSSLPVAATRLSLLLDTSSGRAWINLSPRPVPGSSAQQLPFREACVCRSFDFSRCAERPSTPSFKRRCSTVSRAATQMALFAAASFFRKSPLTDSNRRPPPYHRATKRDARANAGRADQGNPGSPRNPLRASDRTWTLVPGLVFPQCSLRIWLLTRHAQGIRRSRMRRSRLCNPLPRR
jgi:hypothetical protein